MSRAAVASVLVLMLLTASALAHALEVEFKPDLKKREVTVKCFYETGDAPKKATARVRRGDGSILAEGNVDENGHYVFRYDKAEPLTVHIEAEGGHKGVCLIKAADLGEAAATVPAPANEGGRFRDLTLGVGLVLGAAALWMSWRNSVRLRRLEEALAKRG